MKKKVKIYKATRIKEGEQLEVEETVVEEAILHVFLNQQEVAALSCTPHDKSYLAAGFLFSEGFLKTTEQIKNIDAKDNRVIVSTDPSYEVPELLQKKGILTSGCSHRSKFHFGLRANKRGHFSVRKKIRAFPKDGGRSQCRFSATEPHHSLQ
jgi:formate dehydrogenase accessory protein FdhD